MAMWLVMMGLGLVPVAMAQAAPEKYLTLNPEVEFDAWDGDGDWESGLDVVKKAVKETCYERADSRNVGNADPPVWSPCASEDWQELLKSEVITAAVFGDNTVTIHVHLPSGWTVKKITYEIGNAQMTPATGDNEDWTEAEISSRDGYATASPELKSGDTRIMYKVSVQSDGGGVPRDLFAFRDTKGESFTNLASDPPPGGGSGRGGLTSGLSSLTSGIDQGAILLGLTDYLLERADAELRAWAIQSQVKQLCMTQTEARKSPLPGDFLESTCATLKSDGVSILFNGTSLLQEAARKDLNALVRNVGEAAIVYYNGTTHQHGSDDLNPHDVGASLALMGRVLELVLDGEHPLDAIAGMATAGDWGGLQRSGALSVQDLGGQYKLTSAILLGAVGVVTAYDYLSSEGQTFLKAPFVRNVGGDQPLEVTGPFGDNLKKAALEGLDSALLGDASAAAIEALVQHLTTAPSLATIETNLKRVRGLITETTLGADPDDLPALRQQLLQGYAAVAADGMSLVAGAMGAMREALPEAPPTATLDKDMRRQFSKVQDILTDLSHVAALTAKGAYGPALLNGLALLTERLPKPADDKKPDLRDGLHAVQTQLAFLASLSEATTPESAQAAIAAWASPVGSYRTKHIGTGGWVGLNAYVGAGGGAEWLLNVDGLDHWRSKPSPQFAPMVSVGLEFGWNSKRPFTPQREKRSGDGTAPRVFSPYTGLYLQALDLGAIGTFRMSDEVTPVATEAGADAPDIEANLSSQLRVQHVFSPGAFVVVAPFNAPLTIGLGGSLVPSLRSITIDGDPQLDDADALRVGAFLAVDMPLIHN